MYDTVENTHTHTIHAHCETAVLQGFCS